MRLQPINVLGAGRLLALAGRPASSDGSPVPPLLLPQPSSFLRSWGLLIRRLGRDGSTDPCLRPRAYLVAIGADCSQWPSVRPAPRFSPRVHFSSSARTSTYSCSLPVHYYLALLPFPQSGALRVRHTESFAAPGKRLPREGGLRALSSCRVTLAGKRASRIVWATITDQRRPVGSHDRTIKINPRGSGTQRGNRITYTPRIRNDPSLETVACVSFAREATRHSESPVKRPTDDPSRRTSSLRLVGGRSPRWLATLEGSLFPLIAHLSRFETSPSGLDAVASMAADLKQDPHDSRPRTSFPHPTRAEMDPALARDADSDRRVGDRSGTGNYSEGDGPRLRRYTLAFDWPRTNAEARGRQRSPAICAAP